MNFFLLCKIAETFIIATHKRDSHSVGNTNIKNMEILYEGTHSVVRETDM